MTRPAAPGSSDPQSSTRWQTTLSFAGVYLIWGSTYLAVRYAVETIPPFMMAGVRFVVAGTILYYWARLQGAPPPARRQWRPAAIVGGLLMFGSMGTGAWALQFVPSGLGAVLIGTVPMWMVLGDWLLFGAQRLSRGVLAGLVMGLVGIIMIMEPDEFLSGSDRGMLMTLLGMLVLVGGAALWAYGSLYSREADLPTSQRMSLGMEMLVGGGLLLLAAVAVGDFQRFDLGQVTLRSALSLTHLIVFGSIIVFSAYFYLLRVTTPARASTYAYVNPVIALALGWTVGSEPISLRTAIACAIIIAGVVVILRQQAGSS